MDTMQEALIPALFFVDAYRQSLGDEGAERLVKKIAHQMPFGYKKEFSLSQALFLCEELKREPGFVGMIGEILYARILIKQKIED